MWQLIWYACFRIKLRYQYRNFEGHTYRKDYRISQTWLSSLAINPLTTFRGAVLYSFNNTVLKVNHNFKQLWFLSIFFCRSKQWRSEKWHSTERKDTDLTENFSSLLSRKECDSRLNICDGKYVKNTLAFCNILFCSSLVLESKVIIIAPSWDPQESYLSKS